MQIVKKTTDGLKHSIKISIPASDIKKQVDNKVIELTAKARIPGFRPGKVPTKLIETRYGKALLGEAIEALVRESSEKVITDEKIEIASQPKVDAGDIEPSVDSDFEYVLEVESLPTIKTGDYSKLSVTKPVIKIDSKTIDAELKSIANNFADYEDVKNRKKAKMGDHVSINFVGKLDDTPFPGGSAEDNVLELGAGQFIPGFEEEVDGMSVGEEKSFPITFPADYHSKDLAGKETVFDVKLNGIKKKVEAKLDDGLAEKVGMKNLDELKDNVSKRHQEQYEQHVREHLKRKLFDQLADIHDFDVPPSLLDQEFNHIWQQVEDAKKNDTLDESDKGKSEKELRSEYEGIAKRRVKLGLLLSHIAKENKLSVTQDDLRNSVMKQMQGNPQMAQMLQEYYQKNPQALASLHGPILEEKAIDWLLSKAKVTEKSMSLADFEKYDAEDDASNKSKPKKAATKKVAAKKAAPKKDAASSEKKEPAKKAAPKKATAAKKPAAKKAPAKKTTAKK